MQPVLKGHGFSRAAKARRTRPALAAEEMRPQGLKADTFPARIGAAEAAPFQNDVTATLKLLQQRSQFES